MAAVEGKQAWIERGEALFAGEAVEVLAVDFGFRAFEGKTATLPSMSFLTQCSPISSLGYGGNVLRKVVMFNFHYCQHSVSDAHAFPDWEIRSDFIIISHAVCQPSVHIPGWQD